MVVVSLLCRSLRLHLSFALFHRHGRSLFTSSPLAASPVPSIPLGHGKIPRWSLLSLRFASSNISADDNHKRGWSIPRSTAHRSFCGTPTMCVPTSLGSKTPHNQSYSSAFLLVFCSTSVRYISTLWYGFSNLFRPLWIRFPTFCIIDFLIFIMLFVSHTTVLYHML